MQQKEASAYLTTLWQKDLCKAKWQILARAYSTIRDAVGKENAPLDAFLAIATSEIGILEVDLYLVMMNWISEVTTDGSTSLRQTAVPDLATFPSNLKHVAMTEKDIIHAVAKKNYVSAAVATRIAGPDAGQGLLATAPMLSVVRRAAPAVAQFSDLEAPPDFSGAQGGGNIDSMTSYQWTGSMADLYNPAEGSLDFAHFMMPSSVDAWETTDITNPVSMDNFIDTTQGVFDGYLSPFRK